LIWAYAITEAATPPADARGIDDAPLELLDAAGLAVVVSRHDEVDARPTADRLLRHEAVVEALMAEGAVLPLRYGSVVADEQQLVRDLGDRAGELRDALARVRGCVEIGVSVLDADEEREPARSGRDYLIGKVERRRRAAAAIEALRPLATATRERASAEPGYAAKASYLVPRERLEEFTNRARALGDDVAWSGPWPPYSFTG
jgi:hypothetical protein